MQVKVTYEPYCAATASMEVAKTSHADGDQEKSQNTSYRAIISQIM